VLRRLLGAFAALLRHVAHYRCTNERNAVVYDARFAWRLIALAIAFTVWACAVSGDTASALLRHFKPSADASMEQHLGDIVSILVLIVSSVLAAIDSLFPSVADEAPGK
jgi:hypothetical protein